MFGRLVSEVRETKLPYPAKALEFGSVDQRNYKPALIRVRIDTNYVMDRVAVDLFCQAFIASRVFCGRRARRGKQWQQKAG
jgi:hypothetical protein